MSLEDYFAARMISWPFCLFDCDVPCDGATAFVVSRDERAADMPHPVVRVNAVGTALRGRSSWDQFDDLTTFEDVLTSPGRRDNRQLVRRLSRGIARHLIKSTDALTGFLDEVMLIGTLPISATPLARERSEQLAKAEPSDFLELLDQIGAAQTKRLERVYRRNDQVAVIDAAILWDQIDSPGFIDEVHPDSATSGQLASLIVEQSLNGLDSIGWP